MALSLTSESAAKGWYRLVGSLALAFLSVFIDLHLRILSQVDHDHASRPFPLTESRRILSCITQITAVCTAIGGLLNHVEALACLDDLCAQVPDILDFECGFRHGTGDERRVLRTLDG